MVNKSLSPNNETAISNELRLIFGEDLLEFKVVCNDNISSSGEYYLFVNCQNYGEHVERLGRCNFVTGVVPSIETPYRFSPKEIGDFSSSAVKKEEKNHIFNSGDVVLVRDGYLKGLYGIVTEEAKSKKFKVFFSFYVRQFSEIFCVKSLEFIGRVSECEFSFSGKKPVIIGAHVVHNSKLRRPENRKCKAVGGG